MVERIKAIRGMNDILPDKTFLWRQLEQKLTELVTQYGYNEIRFPILESTQLFKRTIGEVTDIVEKEMYTFTDLNGEMISLRPEGTAGCVRACLEHGLTYNQQQRLWYLGPMFRHEKPQKGRYRQFHQFGVETFGLSGVVIELELIAMSGRLLKSLGLDEIVELQINTLGELHERQTYREHLISYFKAHETELDDDSKRRLERNPMRILDSKNQDMKDVIDNAPKLIDWLSDDNKNLFKALCEGLDRLGIPYKINEKLVRGLDYYGGTVFEWVTTKLGSQGTVCAGGRYDALVEQLGGKATPAVGFAMGIERLFLLVEDNGGFLNKDPLPLAFFIAMDDAAKIRALSLAETLRCENQDWKVIVNTAGGSFKSQFKKADISSARFALILGAEELENETISVKSLLNNDEQVTIKQDKLVDFFKEI